MMSMRRRTNTLILLAAMATLILIHSAKAQDLIIPVSQNRIISVPSSLDSATDFGPFDSMLEADLIFGEATVHAIASQQSQIGATSLVGTGSMHLHDDGLGFSSADSFFRVTFELPAANNLSKFVLNGQLDAEAAPLGPNLATFVNATIDLTEMGGPTVFSATVGDPAQPDSLAVAEVGVLPPGTYKLSVFAGAIVDEGGLNLFTADATFDFTFDISILGDVDGDGDADFFDLDALVAVLLGMPFDPAHVANADLNGDGAANGNDIQLMVEALLFVPPPPPDPPVSSVTYVPGPTISNCPFSFTVATVSGSGFDPNVLAKLTQAGQPDHPASAIAFTDGTFFEATFGDLSGLTAGTWLLEVANPGTAFTVGPDPLMVIQCP